MEKMSQQPFQVLWKFVVVYPLIGMTFQHILLPWVSQICPVFSGGQQLCYKQPNIFRYASALSLNRDLESWSCLDIWHSNLPTRLKVNLFKSTISLILMYSSETWTLNMQLHKCLDGCYTNLLFRTCHGSPILWSPDKAKLSPFLTVCTI